MALRGREREVEVERKKWVVCRRGFGEEGKRIGVGWTGSKHTISMDEY